MAIFFISLSIYAIWREKVEYECVCVRERQIKISARGIGPEAHNRESGGFNSLLAAADVNNL